MMSLRLGSSPGKRSSSTPRSTTSVSTIWASWARVNETLFTERIESRPRRAFAIAAIALIVPELPTATSKPRSLISRAIGARYARM